MTVMLIERDNCGYVKGGGQWEWCSVNDSEVYRFLSKPWNNAELRTLVEEAGQISREAPVITKDALPPIEHDRARAEVGVLVIEDDVTVQQRLRDGLDVRHAQRGLDQHLDGDPVGDAAGRLDLRQQRVHQVHVGRNPDLRHEETIEAVAGLLHHVHHVAVHVMGVDAVDADADGLAVVAPLVLEQGGDDVLAGRLLVGGRDGVLEIEKDVIRLAVERLLEQRRL